MKKGIALPVSLVFFVVLFFSGCSLYGEVSTPNYESPNTQSSMPTSTTSIQGSAQGTVVTSDAISIQNFKFIPETLTVKKGATVTWTNNDSAQHQIKSSVFDSNQFGKGQSFSFTFNDTGTFEYDCPLHPAMKGKIIVE